MAELKPCPFCGRIPNTYGCKIYGYYVVCDCGVEQSRIYKQKCDAVKHWNRRKTENCSEKPNNCEHITEDGVTCAKYPACDDCLDNPLNKVKGSERLVKGKDEPQTERSE